MTSRLHLLLVEDDEVDVELFARALKGMDSRYVMTVARNGGEALSILRGENGYRLHLPWLILLDLELPVLDGIGFLKALRHDPELQQSIVFVVTNSNQDSDKLAAYHFNIAGYLLKANLGDNMGNLLDLLEAYRTIVEAPVVPSLLVTPHMEHRRASVAR